MVVDQIFVEIPLWSNTRCSYRLWLKYIYSMWNTGQSEKVTFLAPKGALYINAPLLVLEPLKLVNLMKLINVLRIVPVRYLQTGCTLEPFTSTFSIILNSTPNSLDTRAAICKIRKYYNLSEEEKWKSPPLQFQVPELQTGCTENLKKSLKFAIPRKCRKKEVCFITRLSKESELPLCQKRYNHDDHHNPQSHWILDRE